MGGAFLQARGERGGVRAPPTTEAALRQARSHELSVRVNTEAEFSQTCTRTSIKRRKHRRPYLESLSC